MLDNLLKNKKVIIVGPASYLENSLKEDFINSFDIVVRLNNSFNIPKTSIRDIGNRTDVLYHCLWGPHFPNSIPLLKSKIKILKTSYPNIAPFSLDIERFMKINSDRIPYEIYETKKYKELFDLVGSRPNTGTMAIFDLLSYDIDNLHISGITMFRGGYISNYRKNFMHKSRKEVQKENEIYKVHNIQQQIEYLKKKLVDDRITLDRDWETLLFH